MTGSSGYASKLGAYAERGQDQAELVAFDAGAVVALAEADDLGAQGGVDQLEVRFELEAVEDEAARDAQVQLIERRQPRHLQRVGVLYLHQAPGVKVQTPSERGAAPARRRDQVQGVALIEVGRAD